MSTNSFFTAGERQLLSQLRDGLRPNQIAKLKDVHLNTVRVQIATLRYKVGAGTIAELLVRVGLPEDALAKDFEERTRVIPPTAEQLAAADRDAQRINLECYRLLGPEQTGTSCRRLGCNRGAIKHSVLCRQHHYEFIKGQVCPFSGDA